MVVFVVLSLQYHLMHYTYNIGAYGIHVTLPGSIQVLCKLRQLLDWLPHQKVTAQEYVFPVTVCLAPIWEFVRH